MDNKFKERLIEQMESAKQAYGEKQAEKERLLAALNEVNSSLNAIEGSFRTLIVLGGDLFDQYGNVLAKEEPKGGKKLEGSK